MSRFSSLLAAVAAYAFAGASGRQGASVSSAEAAVCALGAVHLRLTYATGRPAVVKSVAGSAIQVVLPDGTDLEVLPTLHESIVELANSTAVIPTATFELPGRSVATPHLDMSCSALWGDPRSSGPEEARRGRNGSRSRQSRPQGTAKERADVSVRGPTPPGCRRTAVQREVDGHLSSVATGTTDARAPETCFAEALDHCLSMARLTVATYARPPPGPLDVGLSRGVPRFAAELKLEASSSSRHIERDTSVVCNMIGSHRRSGARKRDAMRRKLNLKFRVGVACLVAMLGLYLGAAFSPRTANAQTLCEQDACDPGYLWLWTTEIAGMQLQTLSYGRMDSGAEAVRHGRGLICDIPASLTPLTRDRLLFQFLRVRRSSQSEWVSEVHSVLVAADSGDGEDLGTRLPLVMDASWPRVFAASVTEPPMVGVYEAQR